jgi:outer membrane protein TolC
MTLSNLRVVIGIITLAVAASFGQTPPASSPAPQPLTIDFASALQRARQYGLQIQSATIAAQLAREDRIQARAALLPAVNEFDQFIYTEPNGTPSGVFVANDGPHIYNFWANVHEDFSLTKRSDYRRALAAEALARAKADIATRGLVSTVVQDYYGLVVAQRRLANAQLSLQEAQRFLDITQKQEQGGEAAHADVVKAQLQVEQRQREVQDAQLAIDKARLTLAVLIFPDFNQNYTVTDDLQTVNPLPAFREVETQATSTSPDIQAAQANLRQETAGLSSARLAYYPTFSFDYWYGIDANQVSIYNQNHQRQIGSVAQGSITIPIWTWGAQQSRVRQALLKQKEAQIELTFAQRQLAANINSFYLEARVASTQLDSLRRAVDLSAESLRLTLLRYQAGEATALEVVDAQSTLAQARNAYDDGLARYRVALGNLQTLTGNLTP